MAHLLENMAYVGETPWHDLGNPLTPDQPIEVWIDQAGMDWHIEETPVRFIDKSGELLEHDNRKVLYRSDNQDALSVVSNSYNVVQPREVLEFYRDLTEKSGFQLETAGVLKGGRKFWALANTGKAATLKRRDTTKGYVLLASSVDGSICTTASFVSVRVVCNNTLSIALNNNQEAVKVPHRSKFDPNEVKQQLGLNISQWNEFMYRMKLLSERKVDFGEVKRFYQSVFSYTDAAGVLRFNESAMKGASSLFEGAGQGSSFETSKDTAFGLLNSVTEFVDHERRARSSDHRLDSAWFGPGAQVKQKALSEALLLAA